MMTSKKSTNVRTQKTMPVSRLAAGIRALEWFSPRAASELLRKMFFRGPKRRAVSAEEQAVLDKAVRTQLASAGESIAVYSWGGDAAPRVLLVHGWGGNAAQMTPLVEPLLRAGYAVRAFDGPAHGASTGASMTIPLLAETVREVGHGAHALVAHSMGGASAMLAVTRGLEVKRAVFISPPSDPSVWLARFAEYLQLSPAMRLQARQAIEAHVSMSMEELRATALGPNFSPPLLVIHDRHDREVSHADGATVAKSVPHGSMFSTEGLGHRKILSDRTVIESTVGFLGGEAELAGCKTCGAPKETGLEVCARCQLAEDLYDRSRRWALLSAA